MATNLILCSSFSDIAPLIPDILPAPLKGQTIGVITAAARYEQYTGYIEKGKAALEQLGYRLHLIEPENNPQTILDCDAVYISGGNTFYLRYLLKTTQTEQYLIQAIQSGILYIGESAGSIILAPNIHYIESMDDSSKAPNIINEGLNIISFYPLPHYLNPPFAEASQHIYQHYAQQIPLVPINNQELIFIQKDICNIYRFSPVLKKHSIS